MATSVNRFVPAGVPQELPALATAFSGQTGITAAVVVPSQGQVDVGRHHVLVTSTDAILATAQSNLAAAATAVNAEILNGAVAVDTA